MCCCLLCLIILLLQKIERVTDVYTEEGTGAAAFIFFIYLKEINR